MQHSIRMSHVTVQGKVWYRKHRRKKSPGNVLHPYSLYVVTVCLQNYSRHCNDSCNIAPRRAASPMSHSNEDSVICVARNLCWGHSWRLSLSTFPPFPVSSPFFLSPSPDLPPNPARGLESDEIYPSRVKGRARVANAFLRILGSQNASHGYILVVYVKCKWHATCFSGGRYGWRQILFDSVFGVLPILEFWLGGVLCPQCPLPGFAYGLLNMYRNIYARLTSE